MSPETHDTSKSTVLAALHAVRAALKTEPDTPSVARALEQCDRLELAISQFHADGLRFAAFTLLRMVHSGGVLFSEPVHSTTLALKAALDAAGYPH